MNYSVIKNNDIANGLGLRVSLFVSGCKNHCKGCFNSCTWDFNYGQEFTHTTINKILKLLEPDRIDGITILGGDPMELENQNDVLKLIECIRSKYKDKKTIWLYTGYDLDKDIMYNKGKRNNKDISDRIILMSDIVVDGPFIEELKDLNLNYRGSSNQRIFSIRSPLNSHRRYDLSLITNYLDFSMDYL